MPEWCQECGLRLIEPPRFPMRGNREPDLYCAACRDAIDQAFEEVSS